MSNETVRIWPSCGREKDKLENKVRCALVVINSWYSLAASPDFGHKVLPLFIVSLIFDSSPTPQPEDSANLAHFSMWEDSDAD